MQQIANTPPSAASDINKAVPTARRAAAPRTDVTGRGRGSRSLGIFWGLTGLVAGLALGALIMHKRAAAREKEVVVSVNGVNITRDQFYRRLELAAGETVIRNMVGEQMQMQFAQKRGATPTEAEVAAQYAKVAAQPSVKQNLARGVSPDEIKQGLRVSLARNALLTHGVSVTEADIRRFYRNNTDKKNPQARYYSPETIQVAAIAAANEKEANQALGDLSHGIAFNTVVEHYSRAQNKRNGGLMPPITRGRALKGDIAGMDDALFNMKIGQQIGPRKFAGFWWIIRCVDKKPEVVVPFEKVRDECKMGAMLTKALPTTTSKVDEAYVEFQKSSQIQAFWPQYKQAVSLP